MGKVSSVNLSVSIDNSSSNTQSTIYWNGSVSFGDWYDYGCRLTISTSAGGSSTATGYTSDSYQTTAYTSGQITVNRNSSAYNVTVTASQTSETVEGMGGCGEDNSTSQTVTVAAIGMVTPPAPTIGTNTRASDTSNTIKWTNNPTSTGVYSNLYVERSADGGFSWTQIASVGTTTTSYTDTTTTANNYYCYRMHVTNAIGGSYSSASNITYNTPISPTSIYAYKHLNGTLDLVADVSTVEKVATYEWYISDTSSFTSSTKLSLTASSGSVTTSILKPYIKVRSLAGGLYSPYLGGGDSTSIQAINEIALKIRLDGSATVDSISNIKFRLDSSDLSGIYLRLDD